MSSADRIQNAGTSQTIEYTVHQTAKVHREKEKDRRPPIYLSVVKWLVGIFLFFAVLTCLVASKVSLLSIAYYKKENAETSFIMIVLTLMIPEAVSFFRACWTSLFRSGHKWPRTRAILVGLLVGVLEVFGLCFFAVVILFHQKFSPGLRILMMNGVFIVPLLWQVYKNRPCLEQSSCNRLTTSIVALVLEMAGVSVLMYQVHEGISEGNIVWVIPVALLFVSIAWCPKVFKYVMEPATDQPAPGLENTNSMSTTVELGGVSVPLPAGNTILDAAVNVKSARGKAAIINSLWKLTLIPFMCALLAHFYDTANLNQLSQGFKDFTTHNPAFPHFMAQIFTSLIGHLLGVLACAMCMQRLAFTLPMFFATPISLVLAEIHGTVWNILPFNSDNSDETIYYYVAGIGLLFWLAQLLSVGYYVFKEPGFIMGKESSLFWMPAYNGVFLEQYLLLNRRNKNTDDYQINQRELVDNSCIYICTTMYHEIEEEMEQLLHSLHDIDCAREKSKRQIESHIFFDGATKGEVLNNYVLQLISLIPKTLKVKIEACMKLKTPYGLQMRWKLPGGMLFHIHLKDNLKVKNKKRWSQVMYMSYVLDLKEKIMEATDENTYILTTDADVKFTHESVEALLDLMSRDPSVGAVCGRTHPLGVGPVVWYQVFDYAIGHWFQKVANDVLGSVLCSPGCFSVYRAAALRDVLPIYSSKVNNSADFLTKDMGEDRWLCTLMVQAGWRLEYCAAAEDSTFCPDNFDEFFKQRRRWIPSTLANLLVLISEWKLTVNNNDHISFFFILYQALMVFSTIISPSTVILIMASGLSYGNFFIDDDVVLLVLLSLITVGYALICLYTSQEFQLKVAKLLTMVFAMLMAYVTVGVAAQAGEDIYKRGHPTTTTPAPTTPSWSPNSTSKSSAPTTLTPSLADKLPVDVSSLYLFGLMGIYALAALLHLTEAYCLIHGIWYLFCLPSGYLLLIIYSICNITDRSWGTREEKTKKDNEVPWYKILWEKISNICTCCRPSPTPQPTAPSSVDGRPVESPGTSSPEDNSSSDVQPSEDEAVVQQSDGEAASDKEEPPGDSATKAATATADFSARLLDDAPPKSALKPLLARRTSRDGPREDSGRYTKWRYPGDKKVTFAPRLPRLHPETAVEDWLHGEFLQLYLNNFKDNGYDNVSFIAGMTDKDLKAIGIDKRGHRKKLIYAIEKLPQLEIAQEVPENVEDWLTELGLDEYWDNFCQSGYTEPRMLEDLKIMNKETLKADFGIVKPGHLDKLYKAIQKVQYPSEDEDINQTHSYSLINNGGWKFVLRQNEIFSSFYANLDYETKSEYFIAVRSSDNGSPRLSIDKTFTIQRRIRRTREETNKVIVMDLKVDNQDYGMEYQFWEGLRQACLVPESAIFGAVEELKEKLEDLRDQVIVVFAIANIIWIILLTALIRQEHLTVLDTNVLGLSFLAIYGFIVVIQFLTLLWHRGVTFCHVVARAPWKRGPLQSAWSFSDENLPPPPDERVLESIRRGRSKPRKRRHHNTEHRRLTSQASVSSIASTSY